MAGGGAKPGERRGGRAKGTPNKRTAEKVAEVEASGLTPLDFMLNLMRKESEDIGLRFDAAKAAAPYVHARLSSIDANIDLNGQLVIQINKPGVSSDNDISR
jgi:hypothetical protein